SLQSSTLLLLVGSPTKGPPNDRPSGRGVRPEAYLSVAGMGMVPFGPPRALCLMLSGVTDIIFITETHESPVRPLLGILDFFGYQLRVVSEALVGLP
ncbi:hypothetical protein KI387_022004, partial [Taxus chinensis]